MLIGPLARVCLWSGPVPSRPKSKCLILFSFLTSCVFSTRLRRRRRNTFIASVGRLVSEEEEAASSSSLPLRPPSSTSWPITTSGVVTGGTGSLVLVVHLLVLTVGAGLGVFQPIRNEAAGYPVQPDDGRHLQGAGQIPQQGEILPPDRAPETSVRSSRKL